MSASITVHLQIFKRLQLLSFSTYLDETGIKIHGLLRSFIQNIVSVRVAVPFKMSSSSSSCKLLAWSYTESVADQTDRFTDHLLVRTLHTAMM